MGTVHCRHWCALAAAAQGKKCSASLMSRTRPVTSDVTLSPNTTIMTAPWNIDNVHSWADFRSPEIATGAVALAAALHTPPHIITKNILQQPCMHRVPMHR